MSRGFTLVEVLLSVVIIGVLTGLSLPVYASFQTKNDLDVNTQTLAELIRRANTYASAIRGDSAWGVRMAGTSATLFEGASYATRDTTQDETITFPGSITASGLTDIIFAKYTGTTANTGTVSLTAASTNDTKVITINAKGLVAY